MNHNPSPYGSAKPTVRRHTLEISNYKLKIKEHKHISLNGRNFFISIYTCCKD
jgi:hypothetical protein